MAGILISALTGKTFMGDEFIPTGDEDTSQWLSKYAQAAGFGDTASKRIARTGTIMMRELLPLIIQQTIDGIQADGPLGGLLAGGGEFVGISTSSFKPSTYGKKAKPKPISRQSRQSARSRR